MFSHHDPPPSGKYLPDKLIMLIFIKNMVCVRCKMAVKSVLDELGIGYVSVELGYVELLTELTAEQYKAVHGGLVHYELEMMDNKRMILVERIKNLVTEIIYVQDAAPELKFTVTISEALNYDYTYLSNIFSELEGTTIERFYILTRIKRVKELIAYEGKSVKEISYLLNYSSVAHLCIQFKKVTGLRPSEFKKTMPVPGL